MSNRPKVLFGGNAGTGRAGTPQPEPAASAPAPVVPFGTPKALMPRSTAPKVLAGGVLRERLRCSTADLRALDPKAGPAVLAQALRMINALNVDDAHFEDVVRFGAELQAEHGAITDVELALAQHASIQQAQGIHADLLATFEQLDPEALFGSARPSLLKAIGRWAARKPPARIVFNENYARLLQRMAELEPHERELAQAADRLAALKPRYAALTERIAGATLAANFIVGTFTQNPVAGPLQAHYAAQIEALESRAASLLATRATLEMGLRTHELLGRNLRALAGIRSRMLEEELPAFNAACTAALTSPQPSASALLALRGLYGKLIHTLKGAQP